MFYFGLFNFIIYKWRKTQLQNFPAWVTNGLFTLKFLTGLFIWFIYTFYYKDTANNDIHKFYNDGVMLHQVAHENPGDFVRIITGINSNGEHFEQYYSRMNNWYRNFDEAPFNENHTIIKLNALLQFVSFGVYHVHTLFMCFIALIGWVLICNSITSLINDYPKKLVLLFMVLPSVLFWTSGNMKEPILVLGMGLFIYGVVELNKAITTKHIVWLVMGALIMLMSKFYALVCFLPGIVAYFIFKNVDGTKTLVKYAAVLLLFTIAAFSAKYISPKLDFPQKLVNKQTNSIKEGLYFKAGSQIEIPAIDNSFTSILKVAPVGVWNSITRPYVWEGKNIMMLLSAAENVVVIIILLLLIAHINWGNTTNLNAALMLLFFVLIYFAVIGMCTPVLGNLVRYKAPALPVLMLALLLLINGEKLKQRLEFLY